MAHLFQQMFLFLVYRVAIAILMTAKKNLWILATNQSLERYAPWIVSINFLTSSIHNLSLPTRIRLYLFAVHLFVTHFCSIRVGWYWFLRVNHQLLLATNIAHHRTNLKTLFSWKTYGKAFNSVTQACRRSLFNELPWHPILFIIIVLNSYININWC